MKWSQTEALFTRKKQSIPVYTVLFLVYMPGISRIPLTTSLTNFFMEHNKHLWPLFYLRPKKRDSMFRSFVCLLSYINPFDHFLSQMWGHGRSHIDLSPGSCEDPFAVVLHHPLCVWGSAQHCHWNQCGPCGPTWPASLSQVSASPKTLSATIALVAISTCSVHITKDCWNYLLWCSVCQDFLFWIDD